MSLALTGGVAVAYACGVVGVHRLAVRRRRAQAEGYPALRWLDWDALLSGLWSAAARTPAPGLVMPEGGPASLALSSPVAPARAAAHARLVDVVAGTPIGEAELATVGFSGGEARWLSWLSQRRTAPLAVLERLEARAPLSAAEAYLSEWLCLEHRVTPLSVEWHVFAAKRRLSRAMRRFGDVPCLFFARALASSKLGFTQAVLDDLGRAVFFSKQAPFYVEAVLSMPFVEEARPPLYRVCREARLALDEERLDEAPESG
ncbi:MAG: hypothetical protein INH41_24385 [Myxococcaceae bacterium]|jgi:hypothetical protein|nr:hypothetical protein [Myxococcaceae bacterium]MCA3015541.1 hypothetical protein [Myxococcaceae bacterium]